MGYVMVDIETTNLDANFGIILCAAVKEEGKKAEVFRIDQQAGFGDPAYGDRELVLKLRERLEQCAAVASPIVTWFGTYFDLAYIQTRLLMNGDMPILNPPMHVDLWKISRYNLKMSNNRLQTASEAFTTKSEKTRIIPGIWLQAVRGEKKALDYVVKHCVLDVEITEQVLQRFKPFIKGVKA